MPDGDIANHKPCLERGMESDGERRDHVSGIHDIGDLFHGAGIQKEDG